MVFRTLEADQSLWRQAYQEHGPSILAFLTSRVGRRERAEEYLQETFVRAMRQGAGVEAGPKLRSYLFTTAHHLVISERRRVRPRLFADLSPAEQAVVEAPRGRETPGPDVILDRERVKERLEAALGTLGTEHRLAFRAAVFDEKPYAMIARERGWSVEQVKVNVHRARIRVIALLRDPGRTEREGPR